jgi:hypothetical protein
LIGSAFSPVIVIIALIGINEAGYGVIALLPLLLLAYWLMEKALGTEKPSGLAELLL